MEYEVMKAGRVILGEDDHIFFLYINSVFISQELFFSIYQFCLHIARIIFFSTPSPMRQPPQGW